MVRHPTMEELRRAVTPTVASRILELWHDGYSWQGIAITIITANPILSGTRPSKVVGQAMFILAKRRLYGTA